MRVIADRNDALLPSLAAHLHLLRHEVEVAAIEPLQLGEAHAGRVEQLEDREVAHVDELAFLRARLGHLEQQVDLRAIEIAGQILVELRRADGARGIRLDDLVAMQIADRSCAPRRACAPSSACRAPRRARCARNPRIASRSTPCQRPRVARRSSAPRNVDELVEIALVAR